MSQLWIQRWLKKVMRIVSSWSCNIISITIYTYIQHFPLSCVSLEFKVQLGLDIVISKWFCKHIMWISSLGNLCHSQGACTGILCEFRPLRQSWECGCAVSTTIAISVGQNKMKFYIFCYIDSCDHILSSLSQSAPFLVTNIRMNCWNCVRSFSGLL